MKAGEGWMALIKSSDHLEEIPSHFCCPGWPYIEALSAWLFLPTENTVYVLMIRGADFHFLKAHCVPGTVRNTPNPYNNTV